MRIWDDFVSDSRGVLSWNVGRQGAGLTVFEIPSSTFDSCFDVPYQRKGISDIRKRIGEQHRDVLEDIARAALAEGAVTRVNRVGMDDPRYAIDDSTFRRLAAERGFDWRA
ncbi:MAG TPA: hypothetical protein VJZ00_24320 [Thermoanaerobaculia bacterium]|nr:hypothetical protein [Thermoanaerobaculia bacterium]